MDGSPRGRKELGQHVEDRGLAGAVGANQTVDNALADLQRHVAYRDKSLELLRETSGFQNAVVHAFLRVNHIGPGQVNHTPGPSTRCADHTSSAGPSFNSNTKAMEADFV